MYKHNYLKIAVASNKVLLGQPYENAKEIIKIADDYQDASIIVFPELSLIGSTLGDWNRNRELLKKQTKALEYIIENSTDQVLIVGGSFEYLSSLYNVAYVIQNGELLGIVPKVNLTDAEMNVFTSGEQFLDTIVELELFEEVVPFGNIKFINSPFDVNFGVEVGNDLGFISDAEIIFNLASNSYYLGSKNENIEKIKALSLKDKCIYALSSISTSQTASGCVFTSQLLSAINGELLLNDSNLSFESKASYVDIDLEYLKFARMNENYQTQLDDYFVEFELLESEDYTLTNKIEKNPFVIKSDTEASEIIDVLSAALYHRLSHIGISKVALGVSGGLDSAFALLVAHNCFEKYNIPTSNILAFSMPALATGSKSQQLALDLMNGLKVKGSVLPIGEEVKSHFELINHDFNVVNTTYENVQARYRTFVLMNISNSEGAIVLGTGDMSEIALGWSTFNGDQMSMYNINAGLPKTAIKSLVEYFARKHSHLAFVLTDIINATISPELTSTNQATEDIIGKYEVNDFIMYHVLGRGASKERIVYLLTQEFELDDESSNAYYDNFMRRFKQNQFKRLAAPEGVKIFKLSLSPHGDLKFPGDLK